MSAFLALVPPKYLLVLKVTQGDNSRTVSPMWSNDVVITITRGLIIGTLLLVPHKAVYLRHYIMATISFLSKKSKRARPKNANGFPGVAAGTFW